MLARKRKSPNNIHFCRNLYTKVVMKFEPIHPRIRQYKHKEFVIEKRKEDTRKHALRKGNMDQHPAKEVLLKLYITGT